MKFPTRFTIIVLPNATEFNSLIAKDYWRITKTGFLFSELELRNKYNINLRKLNHIVKKNSNCVINYGNCICCNTEILGETIYSRHNFILDQQLTETTCVTCGNLTWMETKACLEDVVIIGGFMNERILKAKEVWADEIFGVSKIN